MTAGTKTVKGVTYWPLSSSRAVVDVQREIVKMYPECRCVSYGRGWAIQREKSGSYWNVDSQAWS